MNGTINKKLYIETYGCQMNFSDSEIVASIMATDGYEGTRDISEADVIFVNTCSIRENAEQRVRRRLQSLRALKKKKPGLVVGLLGCMGERLKEALLDEEKVLDIIAGPDAYRELPRLMEQVEGGQRAVQTILSLDETYADISPVRLDSNGVSAFISIMRGCGNYCAYCVVPYVRGQERSRAPGSVKAEAEELYRKGYREITLLGQNVNSYRWEENGSVTGFATLLEQVARISPLLRIRFSTSHPKDISDELLHVIARNGNIGRNIHLPVQSGSNRVLDRMNRGYTRESYLERVDAIRNILPGCSVTTDIIAGFCGESEEDHRETLTLMETVGFDHAFMFRYSERPDTLAARSYKDDVPDGIKDRRLREIIELQQRLSHTSNRNDLHRTFEVLTEGFSKRSPDHYFGRNSHNKVIVFPRTRHRPGDYVNIRVERFTSATLIGTAEETGG